MKVLEFRVIKDNARKQYRSPRFDGAISITRAARLVGCDRRKLPEYARLVALAVPDFLKACRCQTGKAEFNLPMNSYQVWVMCHFMRLLSYLPRRKDSAGTVKRFMKKHQEAYSMSAYLSEIPFLTENQTSRYSANQVEIIAA